MHATLPLLEATDFPALRRAPLETLQVNLGYLCNQTCLHCHVNAGPTRKEIMARETIDDILNYLAQSNVKTLDLTGGAPEMNPHFRDLVSGARTLGIKVIDRCNLTILSEEGYEGLAEFLAKQQVEIVASLPCYLEDNVNAQRGKGVFHDSIEGLKKLNALGYGKADNKLILNLVFNPQGPVLPPPQVSLQASYKTHLEEHYEIEFNQLFTITNMPIKRFGSMLISKGQFEEYMTLLRNAYNRDTLGGVMCRSTLSVDWQGYLYDCDFNQMLDLAAPLNKKSRAHISELSAINVEEQPIIVKDHCYGCTAGQGSSCSGALN
ncbi:MAG: arsenosugar biosynthesis radical SAM protein ArsS [Gammaproteobacteria bacterium]|nr:arsenosugar biosynthesis radical SAM protein ArsS [Gammaproteobacteria bacterium]